MAGWPEGLLINKSSHRNIDSVPVFRFRLYYVNLLFLLILHTMLQSLRLGGRVKLVVIFDSQRGERSKASIANHFKKKSYKEVKRVL